jgi:hypothetical protein
VRLLQLVALIITCWLPGAAIFRMPQLDRDRRAGLDAEERLFWAVVMSVALSLSVVLLLASAHRYTFQRLLIADILIAMAAAAAAHGRLAFGRVARQITLTAVIPLALVIVGAWRFFPPAEYIMGGKDPGGYVNQGIQIAQRGAIVVADPVVATVPPFARDLFFPSHERQDYYALRFMGFFIKNPDAGTVVGQFPHLYPASIAIGYGLDGLTGARRTAGVWGILGILSVYFAGARLFGRTAAAAAAGMLALHVIQLWWARYPNADMVMQALLFAAFLASARAHVDGDRFFAPVAGVLLGLLLFLRFDAVLGIAGVLAGLVLGAVNGQRPRALFVAPLVVMGLLATAYMLGPLRAYADLPIVFLTHLPGWQYVLLAAAGVVALVMLTALQRRPAMSGALAAWMPRVIIAAVVLATVYALLLRQPGGKLTDYDAYALRTFAGFYLTLPGLLAAVIGFTLVARRAFWRDPALLTTLVIFSFFLFYKIRIVPEHFWMTRRFLPVILPGMLLCIGGAAFAGIRSGTLPMRAIRGAVGCVFVGLLASHYARASRPLLDHVEYAGMIPRVERLAGLVQDSDLVVVEGRDAGGDVHVIALPLAYIYARNVLLLNSARPDKGVFAEFLEWAKSRYTRVVFLGGGGTDLLSHRYGVNPLASERFQVPEYATTPWNAYPRFSREKKFDFGLYEFTAAPEQTGLSFDLDVGVRDDLHVLRFHAREETGGRSIRWTQATSYVSVMVSNPANRRITLVMSNGGRPGGAPPADVQVSLQGQALGTVRVGETFMPYALDIPPELAARTAASGEPVELRLSTRVWNPHEVLGSPDDRNLGVMVDRVTVR